MNQKTGLDVRPLTDAPWFARIRRLQFPLAPLGREGVDRLRESRHARGLVELDVSSADCPPAAALAPPLVTRLERLALHAPAGETEAVLAALGGFRGRHRLRSLRLTSCRNHDRPELLCEPAFYASPLFSRLVELDLSHNRLSRRPGLCVALWRAATARERVSFTAPLRSRLARNLQTSVARC